MQTQELASRLSDIVEKRYGCRVQFLNPDEVKTQPDLIELLERHPSVPRFVTGSGLFIPVRSADHLDGVVAVTELMGLDGDDLERICDLTEAIILSLFEDIRENRQLFKRVDKALSDMNEQPLAEIISLSERRSTMSVSSSTGSMTDEDAEIIRMPNSAMKFPDPLLLIGSESTDYHQVAFDIHNEIGSTCFLPWEALTIKSPDELLALGGMTIFIRDITKLLEHEQKILADFLSTRTEDERPKIIAGADAPAMDLAAMGKIVTGLAFVFHELDIRTDSDDTHTSPQVH